MSLPRWVLQLVLSLVCLLSLPFAWGWLLGDHSPPGADSQGMASFGLSHAIETTIGRTAVALWAITSLLLIAELVRRKLYVRWLACLLPLAAGGVALGSFYRVLTQKTVGANIGAGLVLLFGGLLIVALITISIWGAVWATAGVDRWATVPEPSYPRPLNS